MGIEPTNLLHAMQALYQLSYAPRGLSTLSARRARPGPAGGRRPLGRVCAVGGTGGFRGWPRSALEFFEGLEADNTKEYFTAHKAAYERDVKAPMLALLDELVPVFGPARMLRPNRDIRFSADKTPYRTAAAAMIGDGYVQVSADGLMVGSGYYHLAPEQLDRYRRAVADARSGAELEGLIAGLRAAKLDVHGTDPLKSAPRGYPKDHPRVDLLRYKGLVALKMWRPAGWLATAEAKARIVDVLRAAEPLNGWLATHVGRTDP
jgi:uncharacterized protein (TIGR02453 family)